MSTHNQLAFYTNVLENIAFPELKRTGLLHPDIELVEFREMQLIFYKFSKNSQLSDEDKRLVLYVMQRRMRNMILPNIIGVLQRASLLANGALYPAYNFPRLKFLSDSTIKHLEDYRDIPADSIWSYYSKYGRDIPASVVVQRMKAGTLTSALLERAHEFDEKTNGGPMTQPQTCSKTVKKAQRYTHFAVEFDSFAAAIAHVCNHMVFAACSYDDPVDQLDMHDGKWYIRNTARIELTNT